MKYPQLVSMPSAVSDWLEEELEARGIDAVVYTRYVLSLLHRDTRDLVSTEQDLHQVPKERQTETGRGPGLACARSSARSRKRFRRSADWWRHVRADVEQIRRSAAVECLMSAAEQTCGIESLVDELCEKLKHFESTSTESSDIPSAPRDTHTSGSPSDLARRYYAAFPPLSKTASANLITLITSSSQRKKSHHTQIYTPRKNINNTGQEMKSRKRLTYFSRNKRDFGFARSMEKSNDRTDFADWDKLMSRAGDEGYSTSDTTSEFDQSEGKNKNIDEAHLAKLVAKFDRKIEALWNTEEEQNQEDEYHDLPVDIQELLASPTKQTVEILNVANKRASDKSKAFIQCGTNITSSIWTDCPEDETEKSFYCNLYNEALETYPENILGDQFNSLSVASDKLAAENETNLLFEGFTNEHKNDFTSLPWELTFPGNFNNKKWSDADNFSFESSFKRNINQAIKESLLTLNHNKEASCFTEVVPKPVLGLPSFIQETKQEIKPVEQDLNSSKEEEDLLTSARTHFRPIKQENVEHTSNTNGQYADGTTFAIKSSFEHVNYRRSDSGTLFLESGFDSPKKYLEYRVKNDDECLSIEKEFVLKFCVKQNEKYCQTEEEPIQSQSPLEVPAKKRVLCDPEEFFFPGDEELLSDSVDCDCSCSKTRGKLAISLEPLFNASSESCTLHGNREMAEINWNSWKKCDKCNNNWSSIWKNNDWKKDAASLQQIWSSNEELCRSCLGIPAGSGPPTGRSLEYFKLREELSEDGEQLLSDLSCLQRVYMEQLPNSEVSYELNDSSEASSVPCISSGTKERKRRHSSSQKFIEATATAVARNSWTNISILKNQNVFTPPLLRPVTL